MDAHAEMQRAPERTPPTTARHRPAYLILLDLGLAEFDVLLGDRIVLLHDQLLGHGARILLGHVVEAGVGARHELDLDGGRFGHREPLILEFGGTLSPAAEMSRKT